MHSECRGRLLFSSGVPVSARSSRMNMQMMHQPVGGWIISARADTQSAAPADKGEQQQNSSAGSALAN